MVAPTSASSTLAAANSSRARPSASAPTARLCLRLEPLHQAGDRAAVLAAEIEQQALEIARDLDVHARAGGRHDRARPIDAGLEEAGQDVVAVGRDDQPGDRQAHPMGDVAGVDVAEIAGRHGEGDPPPGRAQRQRRAHIVDRLGHDPAPVDRVDRGEAQALAQRPVGEQRLEQGLAVVEGALDREVVDVRRSTVVICRRWTAETRPWGWRSRRSCPSRPAKASIAAAPVSPEVAPTIVIGRAPCRLRKNSNSRPSSCIATSLKASVGPWNSSSSQSLAASWRSGAIGGMIEAGVGRLDQRAQLGRAQILADERRQHPRRHLLIGCALQRLELVPPRGAARRPADTARHRPRGRRTTPPRSRRAARRRGC